MNISSFELVTALVVLRLGKAITADDLIAHSRQFLANYKIPRRVEFPVPRGGSGKILKKVLRERIGPIRHARLVEDESKRHRF